jgi:DNA-directed RNA polymerase subunit RPC12/RpoP|nr:MAG TPA: RNA polymerase III-like protein [Caudoviricetes sp.]
MAETKEPPFLVELIVLLLGGIGFLVTLPVAACTLIVDDYKPYAPYWCGAFAVCLVCALMLRNTEWGRRELRDNKKPTSATKPEAAEKGYAPANPNATLNRAALDTTPEKVKKAQRKAGLRCPKCGSTDVTFLNNTSKSTSAGKSLLGAEVFGLEGMVVGAAMGRKGKREYLCNHCGKRYSVRN